jgi:hypothetical protein
MQALRERAIAGGSYNVETSLNAFNLWYMGLGLQSPEISREIMAKHQKFKPRHTTDVFALFELTRVTCKEATGAGPGELFDPPRFVTEELRCGKKGEQGTYLDWTKLITFRPEKGTGATNGSSPQVSMGYDRSICLPGTDAAEW